MDLTLDFKTLEKDELVNLAKQQAKSIKELQLIVKETRLHLEEVIAKNVK